MFNYIYGCRVVSVVSVGPDLLLLSLLCCVSVLIKYYVNL